MNRTIAFLFAAALSSAPALAADDCTAVRAAYKAGGQKKLHMEITGQITLDEMSAIHKAKTADTCKLLRSETYKGQAALVYLEHVTGPAGTSDETVWVSKKTGFMLHQEVSTEISGRGKGRIKVDVRNEVK